ncbi:MAG: heme o synthase [Bacteroidota bacterium]|nr:heme o synthase [Bacteroidota bacterium]
MSNSAIIKTEISTIKSKINDYKQLIKFRLNLTVVLSTFIGFMLGSGAEFDTFGLIITLIGGFLTVGSANGINQIIEKDSDALMLRTENRPLASNRMGVPEAVVSTLIMGIVGVGLIAFYLNNLAAILSLVSLLLYGFLYTPLKKHTPFAVYVGAIPGAIPPMIGFAAAAGALGTTAWTLFLIQFIWQFPHFYSIAWILEDDYKRAGIKLHPIGAKTQNAASIQIMLFSFLLIPVSFLPYFLGIGHLATAFVIMACSIVFSWLSYQLYEEKTNKEAKRLMFGSIMYLPIIFLIMLVDKLIS